MLERDWLGWLSCMVEVTVLSKKCLDGTFGSLDLLMRPLCSPQRIDIRVPAVEGEKVNRKGR